MLISALAFVNFFWILRWITVYLRAAPADVSCLRSRPLYVGLMAGSSLLVGLAYWMLDRILHALRR